MANAEKQYVQFADGAVVGIHRRVDGIIEVEVNGALRGTVTGWPEDAPTTEQPESSPIMGGDDNQEGALNADSD